MLTKASIKLSDSAIEGVREIFKTTHMQLSENEIENFHAKLDYMFLKGVGNTILGNEEEEVYYKKRTIELLEENPHQLKENPLKYASSINNMLLYYYFQNYTKEFPKYLKKLDDVELKFDHAKGQYFDTKFIFELGYYIHIRDKEKVRESLESMEEWYASGLSRKSTQAKMICEFNMALTNYFLDNTKKCLKWCNSCLSMFDMKAKKFRHDLAISTLVLQILVYIDLEYYDLAKKHLKLVFEIAKVNKYDKSEVDIFTIIKNIVDTEKPNVFYNELKEMIEVKTASLINVDKDVIAMWLEKRA